MRYCGVDITFQEVPNEVSLVLSISNCSHRCPGCHSPWLQTDIGYALTIHEMDSLLSKYGEGVTCVCFMGEGDDPEWLARMISHVKWKGYKVCLYSGEEKFKNIRCLNLLWREYSRRSMPDYVKVGPYIEALGGLDSPITNQRMYHFEDGEWKDVTAWFQQKGIKEKD